MELKDNAELKVYPRIRSLRNCRQLSHRCSVLKVYPRIRSLRNVINAAVRAGYLKVYPRIRSLRNEMVEQISNANSKFIQE